MISIAIATWRAAVIGRWTARIVGTLVVLFFFAFAIGEGPPSVSRMTAQERLFGLGVVTMLVGLVVAWFREGWGGAVSVAGWRFLALTARRGPWNIPFLLPAAIGLVHLFCWLRFRGPAPPVTPMDPAVRARPRPLFPILGVALAGLVWHATLTTVSRRALSLPGAPKPVGLDLRPSAHGVK
ncbi:MAG TPA: hypothetical protein VN442_25115 [Bryobacteraceae bacterium]|nr:hypothetical protein [Bryobacteraceae bacterium]